MHWVLPNACSTKASTECRTVFWWNEKFAPNQQSSTLCKHLRYYVWFNLVCFWVFAEVQSRQKKSNSNETLQSQSVCADFTSENDFALRLQIYDFRQLHWLHLYFNQFIYQMQQVFVSRGMNKQFCAKQVANCYFGNALVTLWHLRSFETHKMKLGA